MTNTSIIFDRLKETRKNMGLSQAAIAEICGVKRETWSRYESGSMSPGMEVLTAIAVAGADVQYILTGVRSSVALVPDERLLLERYRTSPQELRDAALRVLLNGSQSQPPNAKFIVHGNIGQSVDTQTASHFTINMPNQENKKK